LKAENTLQEHPNKDQHCIQTQKGQIAPFLVAKGEGKVILMNVGQFGSVFIMVKMVQERGVGHPPPLQGGGCTYILTHFLTLIDLKFVFLNNF
jgi:hypothetical protein